MAVADHAARFFRLWKSVSRSSRTAFEQARSPRRLASAAFHRSQFRRLIDGVAIDIDRAARDGCHGTNASLPIHPGVTADADAVADMSDIADLRQRAIARIDLDAVVANAVNLVHCLTDMAAVSSTYEAAEQRNPPG